MTADRGDLKRHGWIYKFEAGQVFSYDPAQGQFFSVTEAPTRPESVSGPLHAI